MAGELDRAHERIDKLVETVSALAALQGRLTQDIDKLATSVREGFHKSPCQDLKDMQRRFREMDENNSQTVAVVREKKRDWRALWFTVMGAVAGGVILEIVQRIMR